MGAEEPAAGGIAQGLIPAGEIARMVGEEYGVRAEELMKARSPHREARRVLIEMSYLLNVSYRPLEKLADELGGIGATNQGQTSTID